MTSTAGPSVHVQRARSLLRGGLTGGVVAAVLCVIVCTLVYGRAGLAGAALASVMVLFFYVAGQLVMVQFADAGARTLLAVSMASYTSRIVVLGVVLLVYQQQRDQWPSLEPMAIFLTTIAVVAGWLLVEVLVFSRLRIGHYDEPYRPPSTQEFTQ
jgi:CHASE2 domain-containing sensor protein